MCSELDDELYLVVKGFFSKQKFVSPAKLQLYFQLPFSKADLILKRMIKEGFCEQQIGAKPCLVIKKKIIN